VSLVVVRTKPGKYNLEKVGKKVTESLFFYIYAVWRSIFLRPYQGKKFQLWRGPVWPEKSAKLHVAGFAREFPSDISDVPGSPAG
jgi:hypothetical protein